MDNNLYGLVAELAHFIDAQGELSLRVNRKKLANSSKDKQKKQTKHFVVMFREVYEKST